MLLPFHATATAVLAATGGAPTEVQLTVYNNDLGLVREVRPLELDKGRSTVAISDVAARIDPTSVHLGTRDGKDSFMVLEQNYRYDLADPERILARSLDAELHVATERGELHEGTLLSFDRGQLVLAGEGGLSLLRRDKVVDIRLESLPDGLITRPTLVWQVESKRAGRREAELSYLTSGISWHAEYVAVTNEDDTEADLAAWVSIENRCGADFEDARLQLVAGDVHRVDEQKRPVRARMMMEMAAGAADAGFEEESFFEYHLYTLPRPATLHDRETKQLALFAPARTPISKLYEYQPWRDEKKVRVVLELENREDRGLGMPLPKGKVRTYKRDSRGGEQFVGEDAIDHTPRNEKLRLGLGNAFDVVAERLLISDSRVSERVRDRSFRVELRNRKTEPVVVVVQDRFWGDWEIRSSSNEHTKKDARTAEWSIELGADSAVELLYTVRMRG